MEIKQIQVVAVYVDGVVRIYDSVNAEGQRPFVSEQKFRTYGQALQFAVEFEQRQLQRR